MTHLAKYAGLAALVLTIGPPLWLLAQSLSNNAAGWMTDDKLKHLMLAGTVLWFVAAPYWFKEE